MGSPETVQRLREIKRSIGPDIIFLSETKNPTETVLSKTQELDYAFHHIIPPTDVCAGGLTLLWKENVNIEVLSSSNNLIDTIVTFEGKPFFASFIYGDTNILNRRQFWDQLITTNEARGGPWFVTGDFNDIISNEEKTGGPARPEGSFTDLRTFFSEGDLYDIQSSGDPLSWRGKRGDHLVRCRLDRAVANTAWAELYPTARSQYMNYEGSDHKPIITLLEPHKRKRNGLFRYDRRLKDNAEVRELVRAIWENGSRLTVQEKIEESRKAISHWNRNQQRNSRLVIDAKRTELEAALTDEMNDT